MEQPTLAMKLRVYPQSYRYELTPEQREIFDRCSLGMEYSDPTSVVVDEDRYSSLLELYEKENPKALNLIKTMSQQGG